MEIHFKNRSKDDIPASITSLAEHKLIALKKYLTDTTTISHVYVEVGKDSCAHQNVDIWTTHITLTKNGAEYNARAHGEKLEATITTAVSEIERELLKAKKKQESFLKRGGAALKAMLRGNGGTRSA